MCRARVHSKEEARKGRANSGLLTSTSDSAVATAVATNRETSASELVSEKMTVTVGAI